MEQLFVFFVGAAGYGILEILWRGYTHWTMLITGGICLYLIYNVFEITDDWPIAIKSFIGCLIITFVELVVGVIFNLGFGLQVWDYSNMPYNFLGQICLPYSLLWFAVCVPLVFFCRWLKKTALYLKRIG